MRCACGASTDVIESRSVRKGDGWTIRRRRVCRACGERLTTWETTEAAAAELQQSRKFRRDRRRRQRAALAKAERAAAFKRVYLRRKAREEAAESGEPVAAIYQRWGVT